MAPALTSRPFQLITGSPHSLSESRTSARPSFSVNARQNSFGFGKPKAEPAEGETAEKKKPFFFDYVNDVKSLVPVVTTSNKFFAGARRKDPNAVFVAGATGQCGVRIAQMLLRQGFAVRAGVPELASAQELARIAATYKLISPDESKRLNVVESAFADPESIAKSIGPATKAVVTIGPGENGPDTSVTTDDALRLILAAQLSGVSHVAIVYDSSLSSSDPASSTYNVLDGITSFFNNIFSASQKPLSLSDFLSQVVETSDVSYTLIKAALGDDYSAETEYGLVVSEEGTDISSDNKVAKSQIAKLVTEVFSNTAVAENKVVVVSTSSSAALKPTSELFSAIPEDGRRKAYAEAIAKAKAEEEAAALIASAKAREASDATKNLEEVKKQSEQGAEAANLAKEAQAKIAAGFSLDNLLSKAKDFGDGGVSGDFSWDKLSAQFATAVSPKADGDMKTQIATVRGQAKARNLPPKKAVVKQAASKPRAKQPAPKPNAKQTVTKPEVRNVFGGLFKQETIYIDED